GRDLFELGLKFLDCRDLGADGLVAQVIQTRVPCVDAAGRCLGGMPGMKVVQVIGDQPAELLTGSLVLPLAILVVLLRLTSHSKRRDQQPDRERNSPEPSPQ